MPKTHEEQYVMEDEQVQPTKRGRKKKERKSFVSEVMEWLVPYVVILAISVAFFLCFRVVRIQGNSMNNTFAEGDAVMVNVIFYNEANRGDVVVINETESTVALIKRVIAKGGDEIDIDFEAGTVSVNGEVLDEEYIKEPTTVDEGAFTYPVTVPDGHYFVMGDNRNQSTDSRSPSVGFVPNEDVLGTVIFNFGNL